MPVRFHSSLGGEERVPANQIESFKVAGMYTVQVDTTRHWSTAFGYLHEVLLNETNSALPRRPVDVQIFNPFLVTARRWTDHWHTLLYTGPRFVRRTGGAWEGPVFEANYSTHYMVPGTRNFVGFEVNQSIEHGRSNSILRPQMRVGTFLRFIQETRSGNTR